MQRVVSILLSAIFTILVLCPGLCLAQERMDRHACCHKSKTAPAKPCSHAEKAPSSELPAVVAVSLAAPVPHLVFDLLSSSQTRGNILPVQPLRTALAPPLVLRI